jgi:hypothetical protein
MKRTLIALTLTGALAVGVGPAAAVKPGSYSGKTDQGYEISFKVSGGKISRLNGLVPTSCVSPTGGTLAGGEIFKPPGSFAIGTTRQVQALQESAMHYYDVTKHYRVTLKKGKRGKVSAKLHVNFSFETLDYSGWDGPRLKAWVCQGDDSFTAR